MEIIPQLRQELSERVDRPVTQGLGELNVAAKSIGAAHGIVYELAAGTDSEQLSKAERAFAYAGRAIGEATLQLNQAQEKLRVLAKKWGITLDAQLTAGFGAGESGSFGSTREVAVQSTEFHDEPTLFRDRVRALEQEAAEGKFGQPMKFLSSTEIEFGIFFSNMAQQMIDMYPPGPLPDDARFTVFVPHNEGSFPTPEQAMARTEQLRAEARGYIASLTPTTAEEAARQEAWMANIDSFSPADLVNFALYKEFSTPTLGETAPPRGATLDEMQEYSSQNGWLEFRFGNEPFQRGYYDNPNICEMRLTPCAPHELAEREAIIKQRVADLALEQGLMFIDSGAHLNISVYTPTNTESGEQIWRPAVGYSPEQQAKTIDVVSGVSAAIEDGAWMNERSAQDRFTFGELGGHVDRPITQTRGSVRILDGYLELRDVNLTTSTDHALTLMMAAMSYGLEHGVEAVGAEAERVTPTIEPKLMPTRTKKFKKDRDLQLQRMLEESQYMEKGGFLVDSAHAAAHGTRFAKTLGLEMSEQEARVFSQLVMASLDVEADGRLSIHPREFLGLYEHSLGKARPVLDTAVERIGLEELYMAAAAAIDRDTVRVTETSQIVARPKAAPLDPDQWLERWQNSGIMNRAYGAQTNAYAQRLRDVGAEHYVPVDFSDEASVAAVAAELIERKKICKYYLQ